MRKVSAGLTLALWALGLALMLGGCAASRSEALKQYKRNEPTAFHRKTLEWTAHSEAELEKGEAAVELPSVEEFNEISETSQTVELEILRSVMEGDAEQLSARIAELQSEAAQGAVLRGPVAWSDLALLVAARSPAVRAARQQWRATLLQYSQAEYLEAVVAQYRTYTRYLDVEPGEALNKEMAQGFFPSPGMMTFKGEMIGEEAKLALLEWETALRDALIEAGVGFHQYQYLVRAEGTTRENIALLEDLLSVVEERYQSGGSGQADLLKLQTEVERQRIAAEDLADRRIAVVGELNALMGRPADAFFGVPSMDQVEIEIGSESEVTQTALARRQEVRAQEAKAARDAIAIRMGELTNRPLASQGASLLQRGMMPEASTGESEFSFGGTGRMRTQPEYAESEAYLAEMRQRLEAQQSTLEQVRAETRSMARTWLREVEIARRRVRLIEEVVLPQSRSACESLQSSYAAGRSGFIDLLDAERALISARLEHDEARRDLNQALIRRGLVTGKVP